MDELEGGGDGGGSSQAAPAPPMSILSPWQGCDVSAISQANYHDHTQRLEGNLGDLMATVATPLQKAAEQAAAYSQSQSQSKAARLSLSSNDAHSIDLSNASTQFMVNPLNTSQVYFATCVSNLTLTLTTQLSVCFIRNQSIVCTLLFGRIDNRYITLEYIHRHTSIYVYTSKSLLIHTYPF